MSGPCPAWLRTKMKPSLVNHAAKHCQFMRRDWMSFEVRFSGSGCCDGRKIASQKKKAVGKVLNSHDHEGSQLSAMVIWTDGISFCHLKYQDRKLAHIW